METDLIDLMTCKNCKQLINKNGKLYCGERVVKEFVINDKNETKKEYEPTDIDQTCSLWEQGDGSSNNLRIAYEELKNVLKYFVDTKEENYDIIALWIMGTWVHSNFNTYPYLFINAMKGSGKTRVLKLIKELSWQGDMLASLSEAVLFRTTGTMCIDEFESIASKDKNALRELLNTAYKKGGKVKRMRKKKTADGEQQVVEEFSTFRPIAMANIYGMEEILGDRCISLIFEKSDNPTITKKIENFQDDPNILKIKQKFAKSDFWCSLCSVVTSQNIYIDWNTYISNIHNTTLHTLHTQHLIQQHLFKKIYETGIDGRNLELTMPLLLLAEELGILDRVIEIMKNAVEEKRADDMMESRDLLFFQFISKQIPNFWTKVKDITSQFQQTIDYDHNEEHWLNNRWVGKALKRLNLTNNKRRIGEGIEVMLNTQKAIDKLKIFNKITLKPDEEEILK